jgi:hypothetical protein
MRWLGHLAQVEESWNAQRILLGKPEGGRPLERHSWVDNIKVYLKELGFSGFI